MAVPEATVNKYDFPSRCQDNIRTAGQISFVQTVAESESMDNPSYQDFRLGIGTSDQAHLYAAFFPT
jgi:hypothetical protein